MAPDVLRAPSVNARSLLSSLVSALALATTVLLPAEGCGGKAAPPETACGLAGGTCVGFVEQCGNPGTQDCGGGGDSQAYCCLPPTGVCANGAHVSLHAADFDRSCAAATDCKVFVSAETDACETCSPGGGDGYLSAAGYTQYLNAAAGTPALTSKNCPISGVPNSQCCQNGVCGVIDESGCRTSL